MPSQLSFAIAEYTRGLHLGDRYRSEYHGDWIVHRIGDEQIILRAVDHSRGYIYKSRTELAAGGLLKLQRLPV